MGSLVCGLTEFQEHQYDSPVHVRIACHVIQRTGWSWGGGGGRVQGETRDQNDKVAQDYSHVE